MPNLHPYRILLALCLMTASALAADGPLIHVTDTKSALDITINGKPFTTYRYIQTSDDPEWRRPYFFPVLADDGTPFTSDRDRETMGQEKREHPWHRSVWVGYGDVNGIDHWTHKPDKKLQRHIKFDSITDDSFVEELAWDGKEDGKPVLTEVRTVKFVAYPDGARAIDVTSNFTAANGDVKFHVAPLSGNSVEAGWLSARVNMAISTNKDSVITSSAGVTGEKDSREKPADWCDYSGPINGKVYGVAEFDSPQNPGYPTPFHVRVQGLLTHLGTLDWTLKNGESQAIRHRLVFHVGDVKAADLDERFKEFAAEK